MHRLSLWTLISLAMPIHSPSVANAQGHTHHEHGGAQVSQRPESGDLWQTDAALRQGMHRIRAAVLVAHSLVKEERFGSGESSHLATEVSGAMTSMFENCRLSTEADTSLHSLLERLIHAVEVIKTEPLSPSGVPAMISVLQDYPQQFNDPEFMPLKDSD